MTLQATPCDRLPLEELLSDDGGAKSRELIDHLEHCVACQERLKALAGDESWWSDARESLHGGEEFEWTPDKSWSAPGAVAAGRGSQVPSIKHLLSPPSHPELLGRLGRYDIERVIGAGGFGIVLKAHDSELNRPIAVKVLAGHLSHVGAARERFAREGRAAAAVVHEHVVSIYNVETSGEVPFLVMQYVPGRSLQARVDAEGPLAVEEILRIGMQAASGLSAAHAQGLVHRDVKPSNILLEESVERAVLTDFGLARTIDDASLTHTGLLAGTPHYMSPEQASGEAIDHRSDLFGLGAVLYFMATGHPPFRADGALAVLHRVCRESHRPVWQVNKDIPEELSRLIDQLLEKKASRRPATAAVVAAELAAMLSRYQQYGPSRRRSRMRGRWRQLAALGACLAVILAATAFGVQQFLVTVPRAPAPPDAARVATFEFADAFEQEFEYAAQYEQQLQQAHEEVHVSERETLYFLPMDDPWSREVAAIERELSTMESHQGESLFSQE